MSDKVLGRWAFPIGPEPDGKPIVVFVREGSLIKTVRSNTGEYLISFPHTYILMNRGGQPSYLLSIQHVTDVDKI